MSTLPEDLQLSPLQPVLQSQEIQPFWVYWDTHWEIVVISHMKILHKDEGWGTKRHSPWRRKRRFPKVSIQGVSIQQSVSKIFIQGVSSTPNWVLEGLTTALVADNLIPPTDEDSDQLQGCPLATVTLQEFRRIHREAMGGSRVTTWLPLS